jgi:hypothetical protein
VTLRDANADAERPDADADQKANVDADTLTGTALVDREPVFPQLVRLLADETTADLYVRME